MEKAERFMQDCVQFCSICRNSGQANEGSGSGSWAEGRAKVAEAKASLGTLQACVSNVCPSNFCQNPETTSNLVIGASENLDLGNETETENSSWQLLYYSWTVFLCLLENFSILFFVVFFGFVLLWFGFWVTGSDAQG